MKIWITSPKDSYDLNAFARYQSHKITKVLFDFLHENFKGSFKITLEGADDRGTYETTISKD